MRKKEATISLLFSQRARQGEQPGPAVGYGEERERRKEKFLSAKSEFFTASSAAAEFVVGARALLVVLVLLKSRSFPVNLFGRGVIYGAVAPTRTSPAVGVESFSIKWLKDTSVVSIYKKPQ
jgi:hypothetical protein